MERAIRRVPTPGAPRGVTTTRAPDAGLPPDLLCEASRRLGLIARFFIVMPLVVAIVLHTILPRFNLFWPTAPLDVIAGIVVVLSFGVLLATRSNTADPASIIKLGLAYEIALAAAMAAADHVLAGPATMTMTAGPTISRVMIILLAFPVFVPSPPLRTLVAALLAASMDPLAMAVTIHLRHLLEPPLQLQPVDLSRLAAGVDRPRRRRPANALRMVESLRQRTQLSRQCHLSSPAFCRDARCSPSRFQHPPRNLVTVIRRRRAAFAFPPEHRRSRCPVPQAGEARLPLSTVVASRSTFT